MDRITLKNYRCFREEQSARLAPLTLLVGDNSTGKTSFLAMIRILWDVAAARKSPDFKEEPYDLGSFDEISHHRGSRGGRAETFEAGFEKIIRLELDRSTNEPCHFEVTFGRNGTTPSPARTRIEIPDSWIERSFDSDGGDNLRVGTKSGSWEGREHFLNRPLSLFSYNIMALFSYFAENSLLNPTEGSPRVGQSDIELIEELLVSSHSAFSEARPFSSSPIRSKPRRTYDPSRVTPDPEGDYVPMYLADAYFRNKQEWTYLKDQIEGFGKSAGLFDEIAIRPLGKKDSEPFQVQVRKFGNRLKGPWRNLIDVGYGVSQVLPLITELLRPYAPRMLLMQQPEVHLHPSAQAALGSLFCKVATIGKQLIVETHSDHLMDRIRMDVRDGETNLKPEDVSILFFERNELDVRIHSLGVDEQGNITGAPQGYRRFFMDEVRRSLWP